MSGTIRGFLLTLGAWVLLVGNYAVIEAVRGHRPFAMLQWENGGKYLLLTVLAVLALGTGIGYASDRIGRRANR